MFFRLDKKDARDLGTKNMMSEHLDLPPREKLLAYGAAALSDAELLAIFAYREPR